MSNPDAAHGEQREYPAGEENWIRVPIPIAELKIAFNGELPPDPDHEGKSGGQSDHHKHGILSHIPGSQLIHDPNPSKVIRMTREEYHSYFAKPVNEPKSTHQHEKRDTEEARAILRRRYLDGDPEWHRETADGNHKGGVAATASHALGKLFPAAQ